MPLLNFLCGGEGMYVLQIEIGIRGDGYLVYSSACSRHLLEKERIYSVRDRIGRFVAPADR